VLSEINESHKDKYPIFPQLWKVGEFKKQCHESKRVTTGEVEREGKRRGIRVIEEQISS
jgi:hypothetical protein